MLVELSVVEQRYRIVLAVLENRLSVTDVANEHGSAGRPCTPGCGGTRRAAHRLGGSPCQAELLPAQDGSANR